MINAAQSYKQAQVNTVGRADITLMLYDGLLRFLDLAAENMKQNKIQEKGNYISRALDIIHELDSTLNMEKGGDIAKGLHSLYFITNKNLLMANLKNDLSILKSVRQNMQDVRDAFFEAMQTEEAKAMLKKMGPVPMASGSGQIRLGGSIQERADQIKEAQQKVLAIKRAKEQFENAKTDEEKQLAQKELEALLGKKTLEAQNKPVSVSMAQRASRAFMQQQGLGRPQFPAQGNVSASETGENSQGMQIKSHIQLAGQAGSLMQGVNQPVNLMQKQDAMFGQNAVQVTTDSLEQKESAAPSENADQRMPQQTGSAEERNGMPNLMAGQIKSSAMGGLLGKKISLYKNM